MNNGGNAITFDYVQYDAVVAEIKMIRDKLDNYLLSKENIGSIDYESGPAKGMLDKKIREIPQSAFKIVDALNQMIKSMENISTNYKENQAAISNALNG